MKLQGKAPTGCSRASIFQAARLGVVAGLAGGLAEIVWMLSYTRLAGGEASRLSAGVSEAIGAQAWSSGDPVALGIAIHMAIAAVLGVALVYALGPVLARDPGARDGALALVPVFLALVWLVNFFIFLPRLSPDFVELVPYPVSLVSKLLFGFAAALVFRFRLPHLARAERR